MFRGFADFLRFVVRVPVERKGSSADRRRAQRDLHPRGLDLSCRRRPQDQRGARAGRRRCRDLDRTRSIGRSPTCSPCRRDLQGDCRQTAPEEALAKTSYDAPDLKDLFLRAQLLDDAERPRELQRGRHELYQQVVAGDPEFAPAWAGLAIAMARRSAAGHRFRAGPDRGSRPEGDSTRRESRRCASGAGDRVRAAAETGLWRRRPSSAPSSSIPARPRATLCTSSTCSCRRAALSRPLGVLERAWSIEPTPYVRRFLALIQVDSGDYEGAIQSARWVIDRDPTLPFIYSYSGPRVVFVRAGARGVEGLSRTTPTNEIGLIAATSTPGSGAVTRPRPLPSRTPSASVPDAGLCRVGRPGAGVRGFRAGRAAQLSAGAAEVRRPEVAIIRSDPRVLRDRARARVASLATRCERR